MLVVQNKISGYGQGSTVTLISDKFAEYAWNLVATNIVLLVGYISGESEHYK